MADRKAQQKWIPPDFDPQKHGTINNYHGSHHLRERARLLHKGILIIRFELPFSCWCLHCDKHIGVGVRYNAQKKTIGEYYTTPIYEFKMKCKLVFAMMDVFTCMMPSCCDRCVLLSQCDTPIGISTPTRLLLSPSPLSLVSLLHAISSRPPLRGRTCHSY